MALEDKVSLCPECGKDRYLFKPGVKPTVDTCEFCGAKLWHTNLTAEEEFLIRHISKDIEFIRAMSKLKDDDIIEFRTKIAQYKQIAKADGCYESPAQKAQKNKPKCPKCGSTNISTGQRGYSLLTGFLGSNKTVNRCANCGYSWKPGK